MGINIEKDELCILIKKAVREVLQEETLEFFLKSIPTMAKEEMKNIENIYGKPSSNKEVVYSETIEI